MPDFRPAVATGALAAVALAIATHAGSQEAKGTRVSPGASTRVYVMAAFDKDCVSLPKPDIAVTAPPAKGQVSFREGQVVVVQQSLSGNCLGQRVTGTGVYYTANPNASGPDTFSITARLATGETTERSFQLRIED